MRHNLITKDDIQGCRRSINFSLVNSVVYEYGKGVTRQQSAVAMSTADNVKSVSISRSWQVVS